MLRDSFETLVKGTRGAVGEQVVVKARSVARGGLALYRKQHGVIDSIIHIGYGLIINMMTCLSI